MIQCDLRVELLTDVAVSAKGRTLGAHQTLDFIPGRILWGVAAARAYAQGMDEAEAFRLFQAGAVRFFDAVPAAWITSPTDPATSVWSRGLPTPKSWHQKKYGDEILNLTLDGDVERAELDQYESLPSLWRAVDGAEIPVATQFLMRTSIDASGRARDGLLFGLESIAAGTVLHGRLAGEQADVECILPYLVGECRVGRSRSAEYGRVHISIHPSPAVGPEVSSQVSGSTMFVLCLSHVCLRNDVQGTSTLTPTPADFGFKGTGGWKLNLERSFVRTGSYAPHHQKRARPDLERHFLERGSVLTFSSDAAEVVFEDRRRALSHGVGAWTHQGFGEIAVQPAWLTARPPALDAVAATVEPVAVADTHEAPADELYSWATERASRQNSARNHFLWAEQKAKEFSTYDLPTSQWGFLRTLARQARFRANGDAWLRQEVDTLLGRGVRSLSARWGREVKGSTAAARLRACLDEDVSAVAVRLELLAAQAVRLGREA